MTMNAKKILLCAIALFTLFTPALCREEYSVLTFGNSFSRDGTEYLPALAADAGINNLFIGRFVFQNCSLEKHWGFYEEGKSTKYYSECPPGSTVFTEKEMDITRVLESRKWDVVVFQESSQREGNITESGAREYLMKFIALVEEKQLEKFGCTPVFLWNMFWPYSVLCEKGGKFEKPILTDRMNAYSYDGTSAGMWDCIMKSTMGLIADHQIPQIGSPANIIPCGTAIVKARADARINTPGANELTRDGYHMSLDLGRYLAACTWFQRLFFGMGHTVLGNGYRIDDVDGVKPISDAQAAILQQLAVDAVASWNELPAYYDGILEGKTAAIRDLRRTQRDGFIFWTDTHVKSNGKHAPEMINMALEGDPDPKVFFGGDFMPARTDGIAECMWVQEDLFRRISPDADLFCLRGNHDIYYRSMDRKRGETLSQEATAAFYDSQMHGDIVKNASDPGSCYFYHDEPAAKIRYICLDTDDRTVCKKAARGTVEGVGKVQLDWLRDEAVAGAPADWSFIVMMHVDAALKGYDKVYDNVLAEVDRLADTGRLMMVITAHNHHDFQTMRHGVFWISTVSDAYYSNGNRTPYRKMYPENRKGTVNEQAFDYMSVGRNTIDCIRMGYGSDRKYHLDGTCLKVGRKARLKSSLGRDATWISYDAGTEQFVYDKKYDGHWELTDSVATVSGKGVVRGRRPGEAIAVAISSDTTRIEIFPISIK